MQVTFKVRGFYDWEEADKHPGVQITKADVKGLRAKQLMNDKWAIRVERAADTHHDVNIPEMQVIHYMVHQALVGAEPTREDAVCHLLRASNRHHIARKHIVSVEVTDDGPSVELLKDQMALYLSRHTQEDLERLGVDPVRLAAEVTDRYLQPGAAEAVAAQFGPLKGA